MTVGAIVLALGVSISLPAAAIGQEASPEEMKQRRVEAAQRQRRMIFNNDGNEAFLFPSPSRNYGAKPHGDDATPANVLAMRTTPLVDSHVDTIYYCRSVRGSDCSATIRRSGRFSHASDIRAVSIGAAATSLRN